MSAAVSQPQAQPASTITEDEASLYDRQIRLWGLEAQNRMRSSTILILTLRALSQETIKNLVLAGVGRLIVMDDQDMSEIDLGAGLLFREGDGDVGKKRVQAALPQIKSLNPLVQVTPLSTLSPFLPSISTDSVFSSSAMDEFLISEKVDLVCCTDLTKKQAEVINESCQRTGKIFYAAGSYGFLGWVFADLGKEFEWVMTTTSPSGPKQTKKRISTPTLSTALKSSPFTSLTRNQTREKLPSNYLGILAVWEYQDKHEGKLPVGEEEKEELRSIAERWRKELGINEKALKEVPDELISHLATQSRNEFAPTAAILGGLLAQDILRALSRKEKPVMNWLVVHTMEGAGACVGWGLGEEVEC